MSARRPPRWISPFLLPIPSAAGCGVRVTMLLPYRRPRSRVIARARGAAAPRARSRRPATLARPPAATSPQPERSEFVTVRGTASQPPATVDVCLDDILQTLPGPAAAGRVSTGALSGVGPAPRSSSRAASAPSRCAHRARRADPLRPVATLASVTRLLGRADARRCRDQRPGALPRPRVTDLTLPDLHALRVRAASPRRRSTSRLPMGDCGLVLASNGKQFPFKKSPQRGRLDGPVRPEADLRPEGLAARAADRQGAARRRRSSRDGLRLADAGPLEHAGSPSVGVDLDPVAAPRTRP